MQSVEDKILARFYRKGRGFCFSGVDLTDLGSRASVDKALSSLTARQTIRRLARGLYDYPKTDDRLGGVLGPDINQVAHAIARKNGVKIQASGALAANLLGLSNQVPAKHLYYTNGISRMISVEGQSIEFKRMPPKELLAGHELSIMTANALRWYGKEAVSQELISALANRLDARARKRLVKDLRYAEAWIFEIVKQLAGMEAE